MSEYEGYLSHLLHCRTNLNGLASILTISRSIGSLVEYWASLSRAEREQLPKSRKQTSLKHHFVEHLRWSKIHYCLSRWTLTSYLRSHDHLTFSVNADLKLSITYVFLEFCMEAVPAVSLSVCSFLHLKFLRLLSWHFKSFKHLHLQHLWCDSADNLLCMAW